jgi:hypothetical protein
VSCDLLGDLRFKSLYEHPPGSVGTQLRAPIAASYPIIYHLLLGSLATNYLDASLNLFARKSPRRRWRDLAEKRARALSARRLFLY